MVAASASPLETPGVARATSGCTCGRGSPAGGVGLTCATVSALPICAAEITFGAGPACPIGCAADGPGGPRRCPQCWQKENPAGVCLPHAVQVALPGGESNATGADRESEVPHILQKFIPGGFCVLQALHTTGCGLGTA